jgi:hypothetical protein
MLMNDEDLNDLVDGQYPGTVNVDRKVLSNVIIPEIYFEFKEEKSKFLKKQLFSITTNTWSHGLLSILR